MKDVEEIAKSVKSKVDFVNFVETLTGDLRDNPNEWTNRNLQSFLEAIQSWTEDMEGYYVNNNLEIPKSVSWNVFADILIAAKMYE